MTLVALPQAAAAWWAWNRHEVYPVSDRKFEVIGRAGSGAADYWCAAGDFATRVLGAEAVRRVYIWKAVGPSVTRPGRKAVQFSFASPPGAQTAPGYSLSVKAVGDNLTAAAARQYCYGDDPFDPFLRRGW